MRTQAEERDRRLAELETGAREDRDRLRQELEHARAKIAELEVVLERATRVVTRNSADLGADVEAIRGQLATLEGSIAEVRNASETTASDLNRTRAELDNRLDIVSRRANIDQPLSEDEIPADALEHFREAYRAFEAAEYARSRSLFREFVQRHPEHEDTDSAHYWMGKSYLEQNRPASALGAFRLVPQGSDAHDETLLGMADAFYQLHACTDARTALEILIQRYADSPLNRQAQIKLRQIRRAPNDYCTS
jgi:TolA-binding protein